jgi:hypothetical protein
VPEKCRRNISETEEKEKIFYFQGRFFKNKKGQSLD